MKTHDLQKHRYIVLGAARSGIAAAKLLRRHGLDVVVADQKAACAATAVINELDGLDIRSFWGERAAAALDHCDVMILSPGIPDTNPIVAEARRRSMHVVSEIELASAFVPEDARVIAITGTNGKTTTTSWIAHLLNEAKFNAVLGGNIGDAWSNSVDDPKNANARTIFVVETSSFQLEAIQDFHPNIAVLTNLAPDHLDRYAGYEQYVGAKRHILKNMAAPDVFIWNADNNDSRGFAAGAPVRLLSFSKQKAAADAGADVSSGKITLCIDGTEIPILETTALPLPGDHNLENALAAALVARVAGADVESIRSGLKSFRGVEHRIELCGEHDGVKFFNDSKATNVDSLEKALKSFPRGIVLIAGGRDKHSDYSVLNNLVRERVKRLVSIGEAAPLIEKAWGELVPFERAGSMQDAVKKSAAAAGPNDVVLLSPACASFDWYPNYEERGRDFKKCVAEWISGPVG